MKKSGVKTAFIASYGLTALRVLGAILCVGLTFGLILLSCVQVEQKPIAIEQIDSARLALRVDSAAIYRCDTCAFAVQYVRQSSGQVKPCRTCDWVSLGKPRHDKGDVPELSNPPVNPLVEQDAAQHGTEHLVVAPDSGSRPGLPQDSGQQPAKLSTGEGVASRRVKAVAAPSGGDGI